MRRPRSRLTVSTFPFLAVLLCAMGALILLLLVFDRRAKEAARSRSEARAQADHDAARAAHEEKIRHLQKNNETIEKDAREKALARRERIKGDLDAVKAKATAVKQKADRSALLMAEAAAAEENDLKARQQSRDAIGKLEARRAELLEKRKRDNDLKNQTEDARSRQERDLARLEMLLTRISADRERDKQTFSIVPYKGKQGENRRPLYIECSAKGLVFHPDRLAVDPIAQPRRALDEIDRRADEQNRSKAAMGLPAGARPYLMLLIRPDGIGAYYRFQALVRPYDIDFGYEFIDGDWVLDIPAEPGQQIANAPTGNSGRPADTATAKANGVRLSGGNGGSGNGLMTGTGKINGGTGPFPGGIPGASGNGGGVGGNSTGIVGSGVGAGRPGMGGGGIRFGNGPNGAEGAFGVGAPGGGSESNGTSGPGGLAGGTGGNGLAGGVPGGTGNGPGGLAGGTGGNGLAGGVPGGTGNGPGGVAGGTGGSGLAGGVPGGTSNGPGGVAGGPGGSGLAGGVPGGTGNGPGGLTGGTGGTGLAGGVPGGPGNGPGGLTGGPGGSGLAGGVPGGTGNGPGGTALGSPGGPGGNSSEGSATGSGGGSPARLVLQMPNQGSSESGNGDGSGSDAGGSGAAGQAGLNGSGGTSGMGTPGASGTASSGTPGGSVGSSNGASGGSSEGGSGGTPGAGMVLGNPGGPLAPINGPPPLPDRRPLEPEPAVPGSQGGGSSGSTGGIASAGGGIEDPDAGDLAPLGRALVPLPLAAREKPSSPRPLRPARLAGASELVLFIECRADGAIIHPGGKKFSLADLSGSDNPLVGELRRQIDRRGSLSRPGDTVPKPHLRYLVWNDGLRSYHSIYPALRDWDVPKSQQSIESKEELREAMRP